MKENALVRICKIMRYGSIGILGLACLLSVLAFGGSWGSACDLASQFRLPYLWIQSLGLMMFLGCRQWKWAGVVMVFLIVGASQILPFYGTEPLKMQPLPYRIRLLQLNTWASNRQPQRIADLIAETRPDVVALEELTAENYRVLKAQPAIQSFLVQIRLESGRLLLLSRYPLVGKPNFGASPPWVQAKIRVDGQILTVVAVHTGRPIGDDGQYGWQMDRLGRLVAQIPPPVVVLGDFNTGPWSAAFNRLLRPAHLHNTQSGFGVEATYPTFIPKTQIPWPLPFLPLDHALVSPDVQVLKRWNGPPVGSDHLPMLVEVAFGSGASLGAGW